MYNPAKKFSGMVIIALAEHRLEQLIKEKGEHHPDTIDAREHLKSISEEIKENERKYVEK